MIAINCPVCQATFKEVVKEGILIDICTQCKGVWLDRGELEKILAAMKADQELYAPAPRMASQPEYHNTHYENQRYYNKDFYHDRHGQGHSRKKSKLETLFDIFD